MKKINVLVLILALANLTTAVAQINFDDLNFPYYKNGSSGVSAFVSGDASFVNYYNATYGSWAGFAVSSATDNVTSGYSNQYSAITGSGNGDENYMVSFVSSYSGSTYIKLFSAQTVTSVNITNSTYAHNSMRDGDAYSKKFGGSTGNDPDYFLLSVKGYLSGTYTDSTGFFLADFTNANNANDYIVDTWQNMNLSVLGTIDSLVFELSSSDNGTYGMNTPAYFCLDNLVLNTGTVNFSEFNFDYWNGEDLTGGFLLSGGLGSDAFFHNQFYPSTYGGYWSGFAYSRVNDVNTEGYTNQYAAITGTDVSGNGVYVLANGTPGIKFTEPTVALEMKVTNSTYAALSMQNGDMFAKQFGGPSGNDEDWFLLTIEGFNNQTSVGVKTFYLADYRFADNSQDYIVNTWENIYFDFSDLVDSLSFSLTSSDNGTYGMNTPAYFCMDELNITHVGIEDIKTANASIYPNPANDYIIVKTTSELSIQSNTIAIYDLTGKLVKQIKTDQTEIKVDISDIQAGIYIVKMGSDSQPLVIE
ncbi:MAG: DUF4465 domain-containing protein [Bacteroidales bacterium]|nr:DUF4465 domain-containing protein [Bacteroidales bacterium]